MQNCIILGSGRSGTSMVAGTLAKSGYFMGTDLYPPRESNPKGFFEDPFINGINEEILANVQLGIFENIKRSVAGNDLSESQRWLEALPLATRIISTKSIDDKILKAVESTPFCYKDPRFSYTLPVWLPHLKDTVFICIFREPSITAQSIVKECTQMEYLQSVKMSFDRALEVWFHMYNHILKLHMHKGKWLFIHYDQVTTPQGVSRIEAITNAMVDKSFFDSSLKRTQSNNTVGYKYRKMYKQLCKLAQYDV